MDLEQDLYNRIEILEDKITSLQRYNSELVFANRILIDERGMIKRIQLEQADWEERNFPMSQRPESKQIPKHFEWFEGFLGQVEETGELAHALFKQLQCIRGTDEEHEAKAQDALGDIFIYMLKTASKRGWDLQEIILKTWASVSQRDWIKDKLNGGTQNNNT